MATDLSSNNLFVDDNRDDNDKTVVFYDNIKLLYESRNSEFRLFTAKRNREKCVIKAVKENLANDKTCQEWLQKEYEIESSLSHAGVCKVLSYENIDNLGECIVMEYIEGQTLAQKIQHCDLSRDDIMNILSELCDVLSFVHRKGFVHRDLRPENIMITNNGNHVKLIDFGIPGVDYNEALDIPDGILDYTAPEIINGNKIVDHCADIYSIGRLLEYLDRKAGLPERCMKIAKKCIQLNREDRYSSADAVKKAIKKPFSWLWIAGIIIVVAFVLGVLNPF